MAFGTTLFTLIHGQLVGRDAFGNKYYVDRRTKGQKREVRWVIYKGAADASSVPPGWHGWLHHATDAIPEAAPAQRPWQRPHRPNPTGTALAYRPPGHILSGGRREPATGDYERWVPKD